MVHLTTYRTREEWICNRTTLGGSDAPVVMGLCKYRTPFTLWKEKCGYTGPEAIEKRPFVAYGRNIAPTLREAFRYHHPELAVGFEDHNMWTNDRIPFAHASLNGWMEDQNGKHGALFLKNTEITTKAQAAEWITMPESYYWQIIHSLMVTEFEFAVLFTEIKVRKADGSNEWRQVERWLYREEVQKDINDLEIKERGLWWHIEDKTEPEGEKEWKIG